MRIAIVSTLSRPVPPSGEGSVEFMVSLLTEGLVDRGHDVTLFALANSKTNATLVSPVKTSYVSDSSKWEWQLYEAYQAREAFAAAGEFDVINSHSYYYGLMFAPFVPVPVINSLHLEPGPDYEFLLRRTPQAHLQFCSKYQARNFLHHPNVHVIPHGINTSEYTVDRHSEQEGYLAYLGRFHPDKGILTAISVARESGLKLKLAGPPSEYLRTIIMPLAVPDRVEYVGELRGAEKAAFLSNAHALLYTAKRGEPFGLVLIEALASGLPVVALNLGAVPEIIEHGVTGWIADSMEELVEGVNKAPTLNRNRIRSLAERRYSAPRMVDQMEALMLSVTGKTSRSSPQSSS